jgi:hypothetical protein
VKKPTAKQLEKLHDEMVHACIYRETPPDAAVEKFLATLETLPYGGHSGQREELEIETLENARPRGRHKKTGPLARRVWTKLVTEWSANSPAAGEQSWWDLARYQPMIAAKLPPKLRTRVRAAWAVGRLCNVDGEKQFAPFAKAHAKGDASEALAAIRAIAAKHDKAKNYEFWECLCAALVLLGEPDKKLAASCLAKWKATDGDNAQTAIYES